MNRFVLRSEEIPGRVKKCIEQTYKDAFEEKGVNKKRYRLIVEDTSLPQIFYHYTTLETFFAIINNIEAVNLNRSKKKNKLDDKFPLILRATHADYLNDLKDSKSGIQMLVDSLRRYEESLPKEKQKNMASKLDVSWWERKIEAGFILKEPFITSFSAIKDSLPMWNAYSNKGIGVALGLNLNNLKKGTNIPEKCNLQMVKCDYSTENDLDYHKDAIQRFYEMLPIEDKGEVFSISDSSDFALFDFLHNLF